MLLLGHCFTSLFQFQCELLVFLIVECSLLLHQGDLSLSLFQPVGRLLELVTGLEVLLPQELELCVELFIVLVTLLQVVLLSLQRLSQVGHLLHQPCVLGLGLVLET